GADPAGTRRLDGPPAGLTRAPVPAPRPEPSTSMLALGRDLAARALDTARVRGATYADVRVVRREVETIVVRNGHLEAVTRGDEAGFNVRAIADGAWGFAASQTLLPGEVDRVAALAVAIARASALVARDPVRLAEVAPVRGSYRTPIIIDPFARPLSE